MRRLVLREQGEPTSPHPFTILSHKPITSSPLVMPRQPRTLPPNYALDAKGNPYRLSKPATAPASQPTVDGRKIGPAVRAMNDTERELGLILTADNPGALIVYEPLSFICLACRYKPDWMVKRPGDSPIFYECKGSFKREKDILRAKEAAKEHPFKFILAEKLADGWRYTEFAGSSKSMIYS